MFSTWASRHWKKSFTFLACLEIAQIKKKNSGDNNWNAWCIPKQRHHTIFVCVNLFSDFLWGVSIYPGNISFLHIWGDLQANKEGDNFSANSFRKYWISVGFTYASMPIRVLAHFSSENLGSGVLSSKNYIPYRGSSETSMRCTVGRAPSINFWWRGVDTEIFCRDGKITLYWNVIDCCREMMNGIFPIL